MKTLFTYGYTGGRVEDLQAYAAAGAMVVDVRISPLSRVPTWRQPALRAALGASYYHCPSLGNRNYKNGGPILIAHLEAGLSMLKGHLPTRPVVIFCACREPEGCHRSMVADAAREQLGCEVRHLRAGERIDLE